MATITDWFPVVVTLIGIPAVGGLAGVLLNTRSLVSRQEVALVKLEVSLEELHTLVEQRFGRAREDRIQQIADCRAEAKAYSDTHRGASDMAILAMQTALNNFQIKVLEGFVTNRYMEGFRTEIMVILEKMSNKMDRLSERNNDN